MKHSGGEPWYALSNRALAELGPYVDDKYENAARCWACMGLFTVGLVCKGCGDTKVHRACKSPYVQLKGPVCTQCGHSWDDATEIVF